jgi:hypothetical protein
VSFVSLQKRVEFLRKKKILYAVVDPLQINTRHHLLFKKIFDLTFVLTQRLSTIANGDIRYFDTIDEAMRQGRSYNLVIAQSVGNFIIDYQFLDELDQFFRSNSNFFLLSYPLTPQPNEGGRLAFDTRMMVVNVDTWERLGYPGLDEKLALTNDLPCQVEAYGRVDKNFLPSPTPGLHKNSPMMRSEKGRNFLDAAISRGLIFHKFPESLYSRSLYVWPEFESNCLYDGLINRDELLVCHSDQKRWIRLSNPQSAIWIYNSEPYRFNISLQHCETYFGPSAGFKYLDILSYNPGVEFLFYDQNEESLEWIKTLKCNWNGDDFERYINRQATELKARFKYVNSSIEQNQELLFREFGGEDNFIRLWNLFRSARARFVKCDLFNASDVLELTSKANASCPFFYYSNIFSTNFT